MTRDQLIALLILVVLAILAALGCAMYRAQMARVLGAIVPGRVHAAMRSRPDDLSLRYEWHAGTMPPPYHHEYVIVIGPGERGEITLYPDHPGEGTPAWREAFGVTAADLDRLYASMVEASVLAKRWEQARNRPVGGAIEWLDVTARGRVVRVPAEPEGGAALEPLYEAIRGLVPADGWAELLAWRQEYEDGYAG